MALTTKEFMKIDFKAQLEEEYRKAEEAADKHYEELGRIIEEHLICIPRMHRGA